MPTLMSDTQMVLPTDHVVYQSQEVAVVLVETCGCVANYDRVSGKLTVWMTTQAPHAIRTVFSLVSKIPEHKIRVISPDIGGGFGGKVPVYPGYVCAVVAALTT